MPHSKFTNLSTPSSSLSVRVKPWENQHSFLKPTSEEQTYKIAIQQLLSTERLKTNQLRNQGNSTTPQMSLGQNSEKIILATAYRELCKAAHIPFRGESVLLEQENNNHRIEDIIKNGYLPALEKLLEIYSDENQYPIETGIANDSQRESVIFTLKDIIKKMTTPTQEATSMTQDGPRQTSLK